MASNYAEKFKNDYQFLKKYGFVFSRDPFNDERPCYKNRYGEIILWTQSGSVYGAELYIQMNGRKQVVNLNEEYASIFNEKPHLLPMHIIFEKVFSYHIENYGRFHDLYIIKDDYAFLRDNKEADTKSFTADRNPMTSGIFKYLTIGCFVFLFGALILFVISEIVNKHDTINVLRIIALISLSLMNLCIVIMAKRLPLPAKALLVISPAVFIAPIFLFNKRVDYIIYFAVLIINFLYALYYFIKSTVITKEKDKGLLGLAVFIVTVPFLLSMIKTFELNDYLFFFEDSALVPLFGIGAIISVIATAVFMIIDKIPEKIKTLNNKKEEVGKVIAVFLLIFALTSFCPYFTVKNLNYAFDTSEGVDTEFVITDKNTRHGGKGGPSYHFTLSRNGINESVSVDKATYQKYDIGDTIHTRLHSGALGMEYYEYVE